MLKKLIEYKNVKQKKKIKYTCPAVVQGGCDVRHVDPSSIAS